MERTLDTLVIGAGPAGLAVGACLKARGVSSLLLDQSTTVGSSWHGHYDRLHLHTDKGHSALPYLGFPAGTPRYPSRQQMIAYLESYARHFELTPRFQEKVRSVARSGTGWRVSTTRGVHHARRVVVASGYNAVPHVPDWPGRAHFRGAFLHSSAYRTAKPFRGQRVLVVGFGNSGGEIALDLQEQGARVAMAVRGPVNILPREILGINILTVSIALSHLPTRVTDTIAAPLSRMVLGDVSRLGLRKSATGPATQLRRTARVPLIDIGTIGLIRAGHIEVLGAVHSMSEHAVTFDDGSARPFDAVIAATGFRPQLGRFLDPHDDPLRARPSLLRDEPVGESGLYFCGFCVSPTGMLRHIGIEARRIAKHISTMA
jgi:cation diffusion facilitator CzcD-associated flavoprotein CzcO